MAKANSTGAPAPTQPTNTLIGLNSSDTMYQCQQVLSVVQWAIESQEIDHGKDEVMGFYLILRSVREALKYESQRRYLPKEVAS